MAKKTKILFRHQHLASVNTALLQKFRETCNVANYLGWVRKEILIRLHIDLDASGGLEELQAQMKEMYYDGVGEWLQEIMRTKILEQEQNKMN